MEMKKSCKNSAQPIEQVQKKLTIQQNDITLTIYFKLTNSCKANKPPCQKTAFFVILN